MQGLNVSQPNLSNVFPPDVKPIRSGAYKTWLYDLFGADSIVEGISWFDTSTGLWFNTMSNSYSAFKEYKLCRIGHQGKHWQGLLKQ